METNPLYQQGLKHFGLGEWREAVKCFTQVQANYPADDRLKQLLDAARLRAAAGESLSQTAKSQSRSGWFTVLSRLLMIVVPLIMIGLILVAYQAWVVPVQNENARMNQIDQLRRSAEIQIASGQYPDAINTYQQLLALSPDDQAAQAAIQRAQQLARIADLYAQANRALANNNTDVAKRLLQEIATIDPNYRDTNSLLNQIKATQDLARLFETALGYYNADQWQSSAQAFENIRAASLDFQPDQVKDYLFKSYVQLGDGQLQQANTIAAVQVAGSYYQKALTVRPLDPKADTANRLANTFVDGAQAYQLKDWESVIKKLSVVYQQQPDYFSGSVKQWLYEAYLSTGNNFMAKGDPFSARDRFVEAIKLATTDAQKKEAQARYDAADKMTTPTPTPRPTPTAIPSGYVKPSYLLHPTGTPNPNPFIWINTTYVPNTFTGDGCSWLGVTGRFFDRSGKPLVLPTLGVRVSGPDVKGAAAGSYPMLGDSAWLVQFDVVAKNTQGYVQVFYKDKPVSDLIPYSTHRSCAENMIIIDIQQVKPLP